MSVSESQAQRQPLNDTDQESPQLSPPATTAATPPRSSLPRHRPGYARIPSISVIDEQFLKTTMESGHDDDITQAPRGSSAGLGIAINSDSPSKVRRVSIQAAGRKPVALTDSPEQHTPGSADPLMSPPSTGGFSGSTRYDGSPNDFDTSYGGAKHFAKQSVSSLQSSMQPSVYAKSDAGLMSVRSRYEDWEPHENCRSQMRVKQKMRSCMAGTIIALAAFSTFFSGAFLVIAWRGPHYGHIIHTGGTLTSSSAAFLTSFIAKLVELSFVTVVVAFLGQALSRRAFKLETARGVTLAELSMRSWIMQPGTMLMHWEGVRYAGLTVLGVFALLAAVAALLYTSAATALVQPQLKFHDWEAKVMYGLVQTEFANPNYIKSQCQTPISGTYDPVYYDDTCLSLEHAAQGYHNYFSYISSWAGFSVNGSGSTNQTLRPPGIALLNDNTTATGPWVEVTNITTLYDQYGGIVINNVSMAMPHPGVIQAATDQKNGVMQPDDLDGLGLYNIRASVPSPVVHVLCATLNQTLLTPVVYQLWGNGSQPVNMTSWPAQLAYSDPYHPYLNSTPLDAIFRWGPEYGTDQWPPVFAQLPMDYNTVWNDTSHMAYGRDAVYVLGKGGDADAAGNPTNGANYALCQMKVSQTPNCSTQYNASASNGQLAAVCEDTSDDMRYLKSLPTASSGNYSVSKDWPNIASEWGTSLSLNQGIFNANSSNARLLTQLIITNASLPIQLSPILPSMAEALAVMAGCTLLQSATDAPFVEFWNYTSLETITPGDYQAFNASIRAQQYASGGTEDYQKAFYLVLAAVCIMNVIALVYFAIQRDWYTDFSEPTALFSLAVNSPPSKELAGACVGGPSGDQFRVSWKLNSDGDHVYMESLEKDESESSPRLRRTQRLSKGFDMVMSPVKRATSGFVSY